VRATLEKVIFRDYKIPSGKIIENHTKATKEEIQEFYNLDTKESKKQFILLVNKGTEGRNCKSLYATALYRKPPQVFTLQATTRCLRATGTNEIKANIFLSKQNYNILDKELRQNFDLDISALTGTETKTQPIHCKVEKRKNIIVNKITKTIQAVEKSDFKDFSIDWGKYKQREIYINTKELVREEGGTSYTDKGITEQTDTKAINRDLTRYEIMGEVNRHTHIEYPILSDIFFGSVSKVKRSISIFINCISSFVVSVVSVYS